MVDKADSNEVDLGFDRIMEGVLSFVPDFAELPKSQHYDRFDLTMLDRVYSIPDKIMLANGFVTHIANTQDHEDAYKYATKQAFQIASQCLDLATEIRVKYKLPVRLLVHEAYDIRKQLKREI